MADVEINDEQIRAALAALNAALTDMTGAMDEIGQTMVLSTKTRMQAGISPDGTPFAPTVSGHPWPLQGPEQEVRAPAALADPQHAAKIHHAAGTDHVRWGSNAI